MTTSLPVAQTAGHHIHLKATVSRSDVHDGQLGANAIVTVDTASGERPITVAVVVHWAEPIRTCVLGDAPVAPGAKTVAVRISRAAALAKIDAYGFETMAAYVTWLHFGLMLDPGASDDLATKSWGSGNPPETAGDGLNAPPVVVGSGLP